MAQSSPPSTSTTLAPLTDRHTSDRSRRACAKLPALPQGAFPVPDGRCLPDSSVAPQRTEPCVAARAGIALSSLLRLLLRALHAGARRGHPRVLACPGGGQEAAGSFRAVRRRRWVVRARVPTMYYKFNGFTQRLVGAAASAAYNPQVIALPQPQPPPP